MTIKISELIFVIATITLPIFIITVMITILIKDGYFDFGAYFKMSAMTAIEM